MPETTTEVSHTHSPDRVKIGRQLIWAAWGVEIVAASIGILIAVLVILSTQIAIGEAADNRQSTASGVMNAFLGGLPFFVVAMVELTKIPLATACYHARSRIWKVILITGLFFLIVVTFETFLNGFERNFTQRTYVIKQIKKNVIAYEEEIKIIEKDIVLLSSNTPEMIRREYENDIEQIDKNRGTELKDVDNQIAEARITYSGREAQVVRERKQVVDSTLENLEVDFKKESQRIDSEFTKKSNITKEGVIEQRNSVKEQIKGIDKRLGDLRKQQESELASIKDPKEDPAALEADISSIKEDFGQRIKRVQENVPKERRALEENLREVQTYIIAAFEERKRAIETETGIFSAPETIREVKERYEGRIRSLGQRQVDIQNQLKTLNVEERISELERRMDQAIKKMRLDYNERQTSGARKRDQIRNKYTNRTRQPEIRLSVLNKRLGRITTQVIKSEVAAERNDTIKKLYLDYQKRKAEQEKNRHSLAEKLSKILTTFEDVLQPILEQLQAKRVKIISKFDAFRQSAQDQYVTNQKNLVDKKQKIEDKQNRLEVLVAKRLKMRSEINRYAEDSQIYRVAALWMGKDSPADISNEELRLVTIIWFGSLAGITAWTGTLLAFAGLAVQYGGKRPDRKARGGLYQAARAFLIDRRRSVRKPRVKVVEKEVVKTVEVIKEVPVEKVVFKDVPLEVIRKEIVYVPFFSDDPEILAKTFEDHGMRRESEEVSPKEPTDNTEEEEGKNG